MKVSQGFARVRDGTPIGYSVHGDAAAPRAVALVHSLAMDRHFWDPLAARLASEAAVLVYDCRGHGASGAGGKAYSVAQFADDLADLMAELRWEKALVAGASMGGCVALAFAERHPQRTAALGLIDTTAWYGAEAAVQWEERARKALEGGLASLVDFQVTRWFSDAFRGSQRQAVAAAVAVFLRNDPQSYAASCRMLGAADLRRSLGAVRVPTAVVVGEEDYATPVGMAQALHEGIHGSTLAVLRNARHLTPLEKPDEIAAELRKLLQ
ncbi:MAG TPA: alpha/beta fold hydrolase [Burkholderiales bacterium]|jgi:3-oxoadipate enol-lactonase|nr:alpha/beta fold hydrolase [Burkholderiales bacterium]